MYEFFSQAPKDEKERERVLNQLKQIAKKLGVRFRPERVKWKYYYLWKRHGPDMFAVPWEMAYPIDRAHIRPALTYFNQPKNRKFYTPKEQLIILERIIRKALSYGIRVRYQPEDPLYRRLPESLKKKMAEWDTFVVKLIKAKRMGWGWMTWRR